MNSKETVHAAIKGEATEHIPCAPMMIRFSGVYGGRTLREYFLDGRIFAECHMKVVDDFGFDAIMLASEPNRIAHDIGAHVEFPEDSVPHADGPVVTGPADMDKLSKINISDRKSRVGDLLTAVEVLCDNYKGSKSIFGWADAPFAEACNIMTVEGMMMALYDDPVFVHKLLERLCEFVKEFLFAQIELGADVVAIGDAAASLLNPEMYGEFALPYEKEVINAVHSKGIPVKLHMCGNNTGKLEKIMTTDVDILNVDQTTDIVKARALAPQKCLKGNLDPVTAVCGMSPDELYKESLRIIGDIGPRYYILSGGCELPPETPPENLKALISAARDFY